MMKPLRKAVVPLLVLCVASSAIEARPAAWFSWRSKLTGTLVCAQTPLGPGWERAFGPYQDSHCTKRLAHE